MNGFDVHSLRLQPYKLNRGSGAKPWAFYITLVNCSETLVGDVGLLCWCGTSLRRNPGKAGPESCALLGPVPAQVMICTSWVGRRDELNTRRNLAAEPLCQGLEHWVV